MRLTVIGSGDAFNASGALHSCYLFEHSGGRLMVECGPGVLAGMKRLGLDTNLPDAVLVSHHHGDHFAGIPFLYLEYTFANLRERPLLVAGPPSIEQRVSDLYAAMYGDLEGRDRPFPVEYQEIHPGQTFEIAGFQGEAFRVPHNADPFSLAYRLESPDGTVLFSGDSAWTEEFVTRSEGVDLFLCECCSIEPVIPVHTSYRDLIAHRERLGCKHLLITHLGEDVRDSLSCELQRAHDGLVLEF